MNRKEYLTRAIALYIEAPDTPNQARRSDWAVASTFYQQGIPLRDLAHAIRLASLRRHRRESCPVELEPICSLAYFRPIVGLLKSQPHDPGYVEFVKRSYHHDLEQMRKTAAHRQIAAGFDRR